MGYLAKGKDFTAAELSIIDALEPIGSALNYVRVNTAGTALEYAILPASGFSLLAATGSVNGNNATFTFTEQPDYIVSDGVWYRVNKGWTWSGSTATMTIPPNDDIYGFT